MLSTTEALETFSWLSADFLLVTRLFAGDNWLSADFLLVTAGCQQTLPLMNYPLLYVQNVDIIKERCEGICANFFF